MKNDVAVGHIVRKESRDRYSRYFARDFDGGCRRAAHRLRREAATDYA